MAFAQFGNGTSNISLDLNTLEANTWTLGIDVASDDFLSIEMDQLTAPRNEDGSLPNIDFLFPTPGSALIDAGVDIGFPFNGAAPDLGAFEFDRTTSTDKVNASKSGQIFLFQNQPNPFDENTAIRYELAESGFVTLDIYNLYGQKVYTLFKGSYQKQGTYQVKWDGNTFSGGRGVPGIYIYSLTSTSEKGHDILRKKMILVN